MTGEQRTYTFGYVTSLLNEIKTRGERIQRLLGLLRRANESISNGVETPGPHEPIWSKLDSILVADIKAELEQG